MSYDVWMNLIFVHVVILLPTIALELYYAKKHPITVDRWMDQVIVSEYVKIRNYSGEEEYIFEKNSKGRYVLTNHIGDVVWSLVCTVLGNFPMVVLAYLIFNAGWSWNSNIILTNMLLILVMLEYAAGIFWSANRPWIKAMIAFKRWNNRK